MASRSLAALSFFAALSFADVITTTAAAPTSCATALLLATHLPGLHCGHHGQLGTPSPLGESTAASLDECAGLCMSETSCHSFGFSQVNSTCHLYRRRLAFQNYMDLAEDMGTIFYGRGCFACPSSETTIPPSSEPSEPASETVSFSTTSGLMGNPITYSQFPSGESATASSSASGLMGNPITYSQLPSGTSAAASSSVSDLKGNPITYTRFPSNTTSATSSSASGLMWNPITYSKVSNATSIASLESPTSSPTSALMGHPITYSAFPSGTVAATSNASSSNASSTFTARAFDATASLSPTSTSTMTRTTTITTTVYPAATDPIYSCETVNMGGGAWYLYYAGSGYTESPSNPGNDQANVVAPISEYLHGTFPTDCSAVEACAAGAANSPPDTYYSFAVHYFESTDLWQCVLYYDGNNDPTYFNVADADVARAYGFTYAGNI